MSKLAKITFDLLTLFVIAVIPSGQVLAQAPGNDSFTNATTISFGTGVYTSSDAEFSTLNATGDQTKPTVWSGGPHANVWFKFVADTTVMSVEVQTGGAKGTLSLPRVALYDAGGVPLYAQEYIGQTIDVGFSYTGLTQNQTYYIAVEGANPNSAYQGTFSLIVRDHATHDHRLNATEISIQSGDYVSADKEFTTAIGSPDHTRPANWSAEPISNVWFKFKATSTGEAAIKVRTGGSEGTLQFSRLALYDSLWQHVESVDYMVDTNLDIGFSTDGLVNGSYYYISVDLASGQSYRKGSFGLSVSPNASHDIKSGALQVDLTNGVYQSADAQFTTVIGSPDHTKPINWSTDIQHNVWFKFQAPADSAVTIAVQSGGAFGTLQFPRLALFNGDANDTLIKSIDYIDLYGKLGLTAKGLIPGNDYLISVDGASNNDFRRGSFSLTISDQLSNDYFADAQELTLTAGTYASVLQEFTNTEASADGVLPTKWDYAVFANVWFKFMAETTEMSLTVKTGGTEGTLQFPRAALFSADGSNVVESTTYDSQYGDLGFSVDSLTVGQYYYISVDGGSASNNQRGSFSLEVSSQGTNDLFARADELTLVDGSFCSNEAEFSTAFASSDQHKPANWPNEAITDVWHKFTAHEDGIIDITVKVGGTEGSMEFPRLALYMENGQEVGSVNYTSQYGDVTLTASDLKADSTYFIGTDVSSGQLSRRGTFTLCLEFRPPPTCETELWAIASGDWGDPDIWSLTEGGPVVNAIPCNVTKVNIKGYTVTLNTTSIANVLSLVIDGTGTTSKLMLQAGALHVKDHIRVIGSNGAFEKTANSIMKVTGIQSSTQ